MSNKESSIEPTSHTTTTTSTSSSYFEKQRDLLIQEISNNMDNVIYNLDILNRSLNESIQVGKEFDDVGRLWTNFYDGLNQLKERQRKQPGEDAPEAEAEAETDTQQPPPPPPPEEDEEDVDVNDEPEQANTIHSD